MKQIALSDPNSNCAKNFKIILDDFRNNGTKKNIRKHFWELFDELNLYIDIVLIEYMFCAKIFLKVDMRRK